ncbi:MAG: carbohydrate ABC transporter permease [Chloroflexota bacterium]
MQITLSKSRSRLLGNVLTYVALLVPVILTGFPFYWMLVTSSKSIQEILTYPPSFLPEMLRPENYAQALTYVPFARYFVNTAFVAVLATTGDVFSSSFVGYGFARLRFPGRDLLFAALLGMMLVPFIVKLPPLFVFFKNIGWINTYYPLIVPSWLGTPFFIFLMRQFMFTIPSDLSDAARIDGCSELGVWWRIVLPLTKPALAVVAVLSFQQSWNDFLAPLVFLQDLDKKTVILGLATMLDVQTAERWDWIMAAAATTTLPMLIIFYFAQKVLVRGVTLTGMRG